jgi:hypothetical protein
MARKVCKFFMIENTALGTEGVLQSGKEIDMALQTDLQRNFF